jgi:hypothetical protein
MDASDAATALEAAEANTAPMPDGSPRVADVFAIIRPWAEL